MAEKPILMSGPMVRAVLAGRKTVTRRPIKDAEKYPTLRVDQAHGSYWLCYSVDRGYGQWDEDGVEIMPRFQPGDIAWVKEAWRADGRYDGHKPSEIPQGAPIEYLATDMPWLLGRCRPSIFMSRWMSRLDLRVIDSSPERVQDITNEDAIREGIGAFGHAEPYAALGALAGIMASNPKLSRRGFISSLIGAGLTVGADGKAQSCTARAGFAHLWESIHGPGAWDRNEWVWRYEFEVVR